jgi:hypothetical protein
MFGTLEEENRKDYPEIGGRDKLIRDVNWQG